MKLLATILLAYFSILLIQPSILHGRTCCTKHEMSKMACCQMEKKPAKRTANKSTAPFCCPFCNCCFGFVVSNNSSQITVTEEKLTNAPQYIQPYTSIFASDCWRPPENTGCLLG